MDVLSLIGIVLAFAAIIGGNLIEGGTMQALINLPAAVIVLGGTFGATLLQTSLATLKHSFVQLVWVFVPPRFSFEEGIRKVTAWSNSARKDGLLGLENVAETEPDLFARKALQLLVDGAEPEAIRNVMELELGAREQWDLAGAKVFDAMGGYAPTIGIIGAVLGLIHVMQHLEDPSSLGPGIATAFVATIYGVGFANLLFFPVASKIKSLVEHQSLYREMMIEGIVGISEGENPRTIELKMKSFIHH